MVTLGVKSGCIREIDLANPQPRLGLRESKPSSPTRKPLEIVFPILASIESTYVHALRSCGVPAISPLASFSACASDFSGVSPAQQKLSSQLCQVPIGSAVTKPPREATAKKGTQYEVPRPIIGRNSRAKL